jgi:NADH dehydrogenase [ubiquinone] 1 alpha subcomplex assembly factor 5
MLGRIHRAFGLSALNRSFAGGPAEPSVTFFNREVKKLHRDRAAGSEDWRTYEYLRECGALYLGERLNDLVKKEFPLVLDVGAGAGHMLPFLSGQKVEKIIQTDISARMLQRSEENFKNFPIPIERVQLDEERLLDRFSGMKFDLVISNLSLHWVNQLPDTLSQIQKLLKPDGVFIGCMFGGNTLDQLRQAFTIAELERDGGVSNHISPFAGVADVGNLLSRSRFAMPTVDILDVTIQYPDVAALMTDLQAMGESNALIRRRNFISKDLFLAMSSVYHGFYSNSDGSIPATYELVFMIGWGPAPSQPKAKERGSAKFSFKDIGDVVRLE